MISSTHISAPIVAELSRRYRFSAMHRLHAAAMSAEQNRSIFGKCNNPHGHGHNYTLQVTIRGPVNRATGMVVNLANLDRFVQEVVLRRFDFADLNADTAFQECVPSTENLAEVLWQVLEPLNVLYGPATLVRVRVEETANNSFDYFGPTSPSQSHPGAALHA